MFGRLHLFVLCYSIAYLLTWFRSLSSMASQYKLNHQPPARQSLIDNPVIYVYLSNNLMLKVFFWFTILGELVSFGFIFDFEPTKPTQPTKERSTKPMGFPLRISNREPQFPPSDSLCLHLFCPETLFRRIVELMEISCHPKARRKTCWFLWGRSPVLPLFSHDINSSTQLRTVGFFSHYKDSRHWR